MKRFCLRGGGDQRVGRGLQGRAPLKRELWKGENFWKKERIGPTLTFPLFISRKKGIGGKGRPRGGRKRRRRRRGVPFLSLPPPPPLIQRQRSSPWRNRRKTYKSRSKNLPAFFSSGGLFGIRGRFGYFPSSFGESPSPDFFPFSSSIPAVPLPTASHGCPSSFVLSIVLFPLFFLLFLLLAVWRGLADTPESRARRRRRNRHQRRNLPTTLFCLQKSWNLGVLKFLGGFSFSFYLRYFLANHVPPVFGRRRA